MPADRWILARCAEAAEKAAALLRTYEPGPARREIDALFWHDFCDDYLELVKDRLYKPEIYGEAARRSAQAALYGAFLCILKLYAIYVPHITEHLYGLYFRRFEGALSIHRLRWDAPAEPDDALLRFGAILHEALSAARRYKAERGLSHKAPLPCLTLPRGEAEDWLRETEPDLRACTAAEQIEYTAP